MERVKGDERKKFTPGLIDGVNLPGYNSFPMPSSPPSYSAFSGDRLIAFGLLAESLPRPKPTSTKARIRSC